MISWQSIMSVFNTKGTLLKWLKTLDQSLKDGVLESVSVNSVSEGIITLSFNFADGSVITTPQIDIPQGAPGKEGPQGIPGINGKDGESFNPMGEWVTDNEYHPFDYVTYQGSSYLCTAAITDGTDAPPIDTAHWQLVAEKGDQGAQGEPGRKQVLYMHTFSIKASNGVACINIFIKDNSNYNNYEKLSGVLEGYGLSGEAWAVAGGQSGGRIVTGVTGRSGGLYFVLPSATSQNSVEIVQIQSDAAITEKITKIL